MLSSLAFCLAVVRLFEAYRCISWWMAPGCPRQIISWGEFGRWIEAVQWERCLLAEMSDSTGNDGLNLSGWSVDLSHSVHNFTVSTTIAFLDRKRNNGRRRCCCSITRSENCSAAASLIRGNISWQGPPARSKELRCASSYVLVCTCRIGRLWRWRNLSSEINQGSCVILQVW